MNTLSTIVTSEAKNSEKKYAILVLTPDLKNICGVSNYYNTIRLDKSAHRVDYFHVNTTASESSTRKIIRLFANYWRFAKEVRSDRYHLVHINPSFNRNSFFRDAVFCVIAMLYRKRFVVFFRGWSENLEKKVIHSFLHRTVFNYSYRRCKNFIVLGNRFKSKLKKLGVEQSKFWLETTVADSSYLSEFSLADKLATFDEVVNVLFIARVVKEKGIYTAIEAFRILCEENPQRKLNLIIAGDGAELPAVRQYVEDHNISSVRFTGFVRGAQKKEVLLKSHILLFPTYYDEGMPNCILESMLYGMPIVSRYNAAIPDVVTHEENGLLTESTDPYVFSDFMSRLINNQPLYENMATTNYQKASRNFTKERVKERILEIYAQLL